MTRLIVMLLVAVATAAAQPEDSLRLLPGTLDVRADVDSALVYIDGSFVGTTPMSVPGLTPGLHIVHVAHPDVPSWHAPSVTDTVIVEPDTRLERFYALRPWRTVRSVPSGAEVLLGGSVTGTTPFLLPPEALTDQDSLTLRHPLYRTTTVPVDAAGGEVPLITLEPLDGGGHGASPMPVEVQMPSPPSSTGLIISGIATIAFGTASAYFKVAADRTSEEYLKTRDPALLHRRDQLDTSAAVSLAGMQVSLGFLVYFFLSR